MGNTTDIWAWTYRDKKRLIEAGDLKRSIIEHYDHFQRCYDNDPLEAEQAINQAIEAARACGERDWELHLRHWRLQHWLLQNQVKRVLPEAIDLLDLAVDERVKDIPQRICAYHDIVECYVQLDPAGYYQEIKENSEHILSQLPKKHPCADCARSNLARAAAAVGHKEEAERWLSEQASHRFQEHPGMFTALGKAYLYLGLWKKAERNYQKACRMAGNRQQNRQYLEGLLGVARARLHNANLTKAVELLPELRRRVKYQSGTGMNAEMLVIEGYVAEAHKVPQAAYQYFLQAASLKYELGLYREAADVALHAAELVAEQQLEEGTDAVLEIAARAIGFLPPASQDLYQRLAAFKRVPVAPTMERIGLDGKADEPESAALV